MDLQSWGGGAVCQESASGLEPEQIDCRVLDPVTNLFTANGTCFAAAETSLCNGNGEVELRFGSPEYIGLGALVFLLLVLLETFGSPFMRNCEVSSHNGNRAIHGALLFFGLIGFSTQEYCSFLLYGCNLVQVLIVIATTQLLLHLYHMPYTINGVQLRHVYGGKIC